MARLLERYRTEIRPKLMEKLGITNALAAPVLDRIVVNMGVGEAVSEKTRLDAAVGDLSIVTGQHPVITRAKKSISGFKLREGMPVGCRVTLRSRRMYEFLDRLINVVIPRIRDFRGLPKKFDGHGNYSMGLDEQIVFPEVAIDKVQHVQGMNITLVIRNSNDAASFELLNLLGMPFKRDEQQP
ncbi:MAG TPA: 50S ribosomal protein L5 [Planctomycetota bacterium]|nr:50S ribosomal protein L5 [Planctomycetota bacterium]HUV38688.1 50S ribosomal protein L5 [Planctomycetota bacterium]